MAKTKALQRRVDDGLQAPDTQMTVGQLLGRWFVDVLRQLAALTAAEHGSIAHNHIRPAPGRKKGARSPRRWPGSTSAPQRANA